jgi:hypothetical protein
MTECCNHVWQDIGGAASADCVETFRRCTRCGASQTVEMPRSVLAAQREDMQSRDSLLKVAADLDELAARLRELAALMAEGTRHV